MIVNHVLHVNSGAVGTPSTGQVWWDSVTERVNVRGAASTALLVRDGGDLTAGTVANTALTTNPLTRANHTGTQLAATISDFDTQVNTHNLTALTAPASSLSLNSQKITNLLTPTLGTDAANKQYVDDTVAGLSWKDEVKGASTANLTLATGFAAGQVIDGYTLVLGDRYLIKNQTASQDNGIYTITAGAPTRTLDADTAAEIDGAAVFVMNGTVNGGTRYVNNTTGTIVLGTTPLTWASFGGGSTYVGSGSILLTGNAFSVVADPTPADITIGGAGISVNATKIPHIYTTNIGDGSTTSIVVTHNLNTRAVIARIFLASGTFEEVETDIQHTSTTTVTCIFAVAPTSAQYTIVIHG